MINIDYTAIYKGSLEKPINTGNEDLDIHFKCILDLFNFSSFNDVPDLSKTKQITERQHKLLKKSVKLYGNMTDVKTAYELDMLFLYTPKVKKNRDTLFFLYMYKRDPDFGKEVVFEILAEYNYFT